MHTANEPLRTLFELTAGHKAFSVLQQRPGEEVGGVGSGKTELHRVTRVVQPVATRRHPEDNRGQKIITDCLIGILNWDP